MPSRWNAWTTLQNVQFDYEKTPKIGRCGCVVADRLPATQPELACREWK